MRVWIDRLNGWSVTTDKFGDTYVTTSARGLFLDAKYTTNSERHAAINHAALVEHAKRTPLEPLVATRRH